MRANFVELHFATDNRPVYIRPEHVVVFHTFIASSKPETSIVSSTAPPRQSTAIYLDRESPIQSVVVLETVDEVAALLAPTVQ